MNRSKRVSTMPDEYYGFSSFQKRRSDPKASLFSFDFAAKRKKTVKKENTANEKEQATSMAQTKMSKTPSPANNSTLPSSVQRKKTAIAIPLLESATGSKIRVLKSNGPSSLIKDKDKNPSKAVVKQNLFRVPVSNQSLERVTLYQKKTFTKNGKGLKVKAGKSSSLVKKIKILESGSGNGTLSSTKDDNERSTSVSLKINRTTAADGDPKLTKRTFVKVARLTKEEVEKYMRSPSDTSSSSVPIDCPNAAMQEQDVSVEEDDEEDNIVAEENSSVEEEEEAIIVEEENLGMEEEDVIVAEENDAVEEEQESEGSVINILMHDNVNDYMRLQNSGLTDNVVAVDNRTIDISLGYVDKETLLDGALDIFPGVGFSMCQPSFPGSNLTFGLVTIEPQTVKPPDMFDDAEMVFWVLEGEVTVKSTAGFVSYRNGAKVLDGHKCKTGSGFHVPPNACYILENWGNSKAVLCFSAHAIRPIQE